jgi:sulfate-transporting ATPase/ATP-binding cassette subfamily B protein
LNSFLGSYALTISYRGRLIDHLQRLPLGIFGRQRIGQMAAVITDDVKRVEDIFTHLTAELLAAVSVPLLFALVLAWVDWRLTLLLLISLPLATWALNGANRFFLAHGGRKQALFLDTSGLIVEFVTGVRTLRLFHRADEWLRQLDERFTRIRHASMGAEAWGGGSVQIYRLVMEGGLVLLLLGAGWLIGTQGLSSVSWLLFVVAAYKLLDPLLDAAAYLVELRAMVQGEARLQELLDEAPLDEGSVTGAPACFDVEYRGVNFAYGQQQVLHDISFCAMEGGITAIVGPSGAGKSSLLYLLARFQDPQQGQIMLGGIDLRRMHSDALYQHLGFVFQDVQLFDGSILDNVRIGRADASDEAVIAACRNAFCDEFVQRLPQGYATRIGENGQQLSGGERQRLSIARALLKDAPVLLLDEATASVDPQSQHEIQRALSRLVKGRTVIMIAHRLHTIRRADQILVLDEGRLRECGTHQTLLASNGLYAELWREQQAGIDVAEASMPYVTECQ